MPLVGRPARQQTAEQEEGGSVELLDPVSFEAKLLEARSRREAATAWRAPPQLGPPDRLGLPAREIVAESAVPIHWSRERPAPELVPHAGPTPRRSRLSGGLALFLGFAFGAVLAGGVLALPPSLWEWARGRGAATPPAITSQANDTSPAATQVRPAKVGPPVASPDTTPAGLPPAIVAQRFPHAQAPTVPLDVAATDPLPAPRAFSAPTAEVANPAAFPQAAGPATQPQPWPTVPAIPAPTLGADRPEVPDEISVAALTRPNAVEAPPETFTQPAIVLPKIGPAGSAFPRVAAPAPPADAFPPRPPALTPSAISTEVARLSAGPVLRLADPLPDPRAHAEELARLGDFPVLHDDGAPAAVQATPPAQPARAVPASAPRPSAATPVATAPPPQAGPAEARPGPAERARRARLERGVEDLLRKRLNIR